MIQGGLLLLCNELAYTGIPYMWVGEHVSVFRSCMGTCGSHSQPNAPCDTGLGFPEPFTLKCHAQSVR